MQPTAPRNIILLVVDSLRYDAVHGGPVGLPRALPRASVWSAAQAAGCWTLPATASIFTGLLPHEHGATAQTRRLRPDRPTLAEGLRAAGFSTHQITANGATTGLFGLDRGFDEVVRIWEQVPAHHARLQSLLVALARPRIRQKLFSADLLRGELAGDLASARVWLQRTADAILDRARRTLQANAARGRRSFLFLNLMDAHFPYHVADTFSLTGEGPVDQLAELGALFHTCNMTWLTTGRSHVSPALRSQLRQRQRRAWEGLAPRLDAFLDELYQPGNLVILTSDHGENFGEQGWLYHFANVTDAGTRVPLFWLQAEGPPPAHHSHPVSARGLYGAIRAAAGLQEADPLRDPDEAPVMEAFWYNNLGRTLPAYRHDQLAFLIGDQRYRYVHGAWSTAPRTPGCAPEPPFRALPTGINPIEDSALPPARKARLRGILSAHQAFSARLSH